MDFSKQQIAFAGVLVSVNLAFFPNHFDKLHPWAGTLTKVAWLLLVLSIVSGLLLLGRATYLSREPVTADSVLDTRLRWFGAGQFSLLIPGIAFLILVVFCGYVPSDCFCFDADMK